MTQPAKVPATYPLTCCDAFSAPSLQELYGLYLADDHDGALEALDRFTDLYATGELGEFHAIVDAIILETRACA